MAPLQDWYVPPHGQGWGCSPYILSADTRDRLAQLAKSLAEMHPAQYVETD